MFWTQFPCSVSVSHNISWCRWNLHITIMVEFCHMWSGIWPVPSNKCGKWTKQSFVKWNLQSWRCITAKQMLVGLPGADNFMFQPLFFLSESTGEIRMIWRWMSHNLLFMPTILLIISCLSANFIAFSKIRVILSIVYFSCFCY